MTFGLSNWPLLVVGHLDRFGAVIGHFWCLFLDNFTR